MEKVLNGVELTVSAMNARGFGVASLDDLSVEIAHAIPGDVVAVELRKKMRKVRKGRLLEVLKDSSDRVPPPCPHAHICGGCTWQQMDYGAQLKEKQRRLEEVLASFAPVSPILPAQNIFRHRNKMEFTFSQTKEGQKYLGLMIAQSEPYVFNVEDCHLCSPWVSSLVQTVRFWWENSALQAYYPYRDRGSLRYLTVREAFRTGGKMAILNVSGNPDFALNRNQVDSFVKSVTSLIPDISLFLRIHQLKKGVPTQFYEMHLAGPDHIVEDLFLEGGKLSFHISPSSFFQPNTVQAEHLYNEALRLIEPLAPSVIFDLYCGTGTLGMAASRKGKKVIGVELSAEAVLDAEKNKEQNKITNCTFYQGDVGKVLAKLLDERPDLVIVDPPRVGLDASAMNHLQTLCPKAILYVSCNPMSQGENIKQLISFGYRVEKFQPVDQFPHTHHIENIALLVR